MRLVERFKACCATLAWLSVVLALAAGRTHTGLAAGQAALLDTAADAVLGQTSFTGDAPNSGGLSAASLRLPGGVAVDEGSGRLYVADSDNNRVLGWPSAATFADGQAADLVIGQSSFITNTIPVTPSAASLESPAGLAVDAGGNLYVADTGNNRVLVYVSPATTDLVADRVIGQPDFITNTVPVTPSAASLESPAGLAVDAQGNLYVADPWNNRVLEYDAPLTTDAIADRVFGQPGFSGNEFLDPPGAASLSFPLGVAVDAGGDLYVADSDNNRVLRYGAPLTTDAVADRVFGQPDFNSNSIPLAASALNLSGPAGLALDNAGYLYVADSFSNRVVVYAAPRSSDTAADHVVGQPDLGSDDFVSPPTASSLNYPSAVYVDRDRNLYVADTDNHRLLRFDIPIPAALFLPLLLR